MSERHTPDASAGKPERWGLPRPSVTEWLALIAGLFIVHHYAWLYDDAFIYFRYVDNLIYLGYGLVYNQGEYAEGFTSPLWAMILIALRSMGLGYWAITLGIAYLSYLAYWFGLVVFNHRVVRDRFVSINLPLCYSVFVYGVGAYFTSGLESPLIQVVAVGYALFILSPASIVPMLLVAVSPLVRPELAMPLVIVTLWSGWRRRRIPWALLITAFALNAVWLIFRVWYYADLLPVTFYLKNIVDIPQGLIYLNNTFGEYHTWVLFALALAVLVFLWRTASDEDLLFLPERAVILLVAVAVAVYVVKIGGNAQHFRYLSFSFCLALTALAGIPEGALSRWTDLEKFRSPEIGRRLVPQACALAFGLVFALWGFIGYPAQLSSHPFFEEAESEWINKIYDSYWHRHNDPFVQNVIRGWDQVESYALFRREVPSLEYQGVESGFWCGDNYRRFHYRIIHSLGLTDPILARTIMPSDRPSHKFGLISLAEQMRDLQREFSTEPGCYRRAVEAGRAPAWVVRNLDSIEQIEAKSRNRHDFLENLRLALTPVPPIDPRPDASSPPPS